VTIRAGSIISRLATVVGAAGIAITESYANY
jgi:hypothetical protein